MIEVKDNLFVGTEMDCNVAGNDGYAIVHACKHPCHQRGVGYSGNLQPTHPNYLILENGDDLYLNIVDMDRPLLPRFADPMMEKAMEFIETKINTKKVLIHCNLGQSRAPSISLLYLAKKNMITNNSFEEAVEEFKKLYSEYNPSGGISHYLQNNWQRLMS